MADSRTGMAVATDNQMNNQPLKDPVPKEEGEQRATVNSPRLQNDGFPKKKGTFKITSIKLNDADGDSMDDLDESHTEVTEDVSSEILDISKTTDVDQDALSEDIILSMPTASHDPEVVAKDVSGESVVKDGKEKTGADMHSRFRVVKIETKEPFRRGRWICHDFLDTQPPVSTDKSDTKAHDDANSGSSSAGSSIHYVHGVDDPSKNPLLSGATGTVPVSVSQSDLQTPAKHESFQPIQPAPNTAGSQQNINTSVSGSHVPQSQSYYTDSSQNPVLSKPSCQTMPQSHSHQSLSTQATSDNIQNINQAPPSVQGQGNVPQATVDNAGNVGAILQQPGTYRIDHNSSIQTVDSQIGVSGSTSSLQSVYPPNIQSTAGSMTTLPSASTGVVVCGVDTTGTYQPYVPHQAGSQVTQSGMTDTTTSRSLASEAAPTSTIPANPGDQTTQLAAMTDQTLPSSFIPFNEVLDKDLNVIQNAALLSPLAAAVGGMQSPQEEQSLR